MSHVFLPLREFPTAGDCGNRHLKFLLKIVDFWAANSNWSKASNANFKERETRLIEYLKF